MRNARPEIKTRRRIYKHTRRGKLAERRSRLKNWPSRLQIEQKRRLWRYGLTPEAYELMEAQQNGQCAICKRIPNHKLHVDHCHTTNKVRGLLCGSCNRALGLLKDNTEFLIAAIHYLQQ